MTSDAESGFATIPESYDLREDLPTLEQFAELRDAAGLPARSREGIERGLPNSLYGVTVAYGPNDEVVGMGRIIGDGRTVFQIGDLAVRPEHQGNGLGTAMMAALVSHLEENAPPRAYVNLMADTDGFYDRFGFKETRPESKGMYRRTGEER
ncbi:GNAT family N-acetyltransferase [Halostagnicola sp. A-GB9-2]|uniref:GNAT family N-acetyltransferase n=1 Tax=Halostagnicola sp. A-GB9-2 TaxID=3048066 RepID=UPI0024C0306D|nr:GNAT family N-acetyltransferase [Halostagnicola sp. A-GB9-2]MDJ1432801.1 GNAT family N-acetyltransferase [Halostagnicola sp. A-GB9-2]